MSNIVPYEITTVRVVVRFSLDICFLALNELATFRATLYDAEDKVVEAVNVIIQGEDYARWSTNDDYIINYIANELGFTRAQ